MPNIKYKYVGDEDIILAQIGPVKSGDIIDLTEDQAAAVDKNAPDEFERVVEKSTPPAVKPASPAK